MEGVIDHHAHLLAVCARETMPYDPKDPASISAAHREMAARGVTPTDDDRSFDEPNLERAFLDGLRHAATLGIAEITEAGLRSHEHLDTLLHLRSHGPLPVKVRILVASGLAERAMPQRTGDDEVEVIGVKFYADGWLGPRTCAVTEPFEDGERDRGVLFLEAEKLARRARPFAEAGWQIATHAIGDRAIEAVLDAYERIWGTDVASAAPRIEHAQVLNADLISRMAEMGVVACIQPCFAVSDTPAALAGLGPERAGSSYAWDRLLDAGVRVITGSDFPIEPLDPAVGLERLVSGAPISAGLPEQVARDLLTRL